MNSYATSIGVSAALALLGWMLVRKDIIPYQQAAALGAAPSGAVEVK